MYFISKRGWHTFHDHPESVWDISNGKNSTCTLAENVFTVNALEFGWTVIYA